jgi:hypothetical protein
MNETMLPEMFYAAALAAYYCSTDEGWEKFTGWAREEGILLDGEEMSRDLMRTSSSGIKLITRQVEIELLAARLSGVLPDENLYAYEHVAGSCCMPRHEYGSLLPPGEYRGTPRRQGNHRRA